MAATATGPPGFLGHSYLTLAQCHESLAVKVTAADAARQRLLSYATRLTRDELRRGVWVTVQRLLAEKDPPRLRVVLQQLLTRKARPSTVPQRLEDAAAGLRLPKGGWSQAEWDLSELLRDLGGARAAHALRQVSGAPSLSELQRHRQQRPSVGDARPCGSRAPRARQPPRRAARSLSREDGVGGRV